jgi:hypothetical protein
MTMVTIIGRGHSGTRVISQTLSASRVFMGTPLNVAGDLLPPDDMYEACRVLARHVQWYGDLEWDWSTLHTMDIPEEFTRLILNYLETVLECPAKYKGWKIPETTLIFPWIVRMFPEIKYVMWIRNPRDCILGPHITDDLSVFGIQYPTTEDERYRRAISWKYQYDLIRATPKPEHWIEIRFEDFILKQAETLARLEDFLSIKLVKVRVKPKPVGRWKYDQGVNYYDFFESMMREYGYEMPVQV